MCWRACAFSYTGVVSRLKININLKRLSLDQPIVVSLDEGGWMWPSYEDVACL
jgi:hypothetical protein